MKLKIRDTLRYATKSRKQPADVLLAFDAPQPINSVIPYAPWRFRIAEELTREEFTRRMAAVQAKPDSVSGNVPVGLGSEHGQDTAAPDESKRYFYAAEVI